MPMNIDLVNDVDPVKAFFVVLLGSAFAAVLIYIYQSSIAPAIMQAFPRTQAQTQG